MKFYDSVLRSLRDGEHTFAAIYRCSFGFRDEVFFEYSRDMRIFATTYGECERSVLRADAALRVRLSDVPEGGVVGLRLPNSPEWVVLFWALLRAGFRPLLLSPDGDGAATHALREAGARAVVGEGGIPSAEILGSALLELPPRWADEVLLTTSGTAGEAKVCAYDGRAIVSQILNARHILDINPDIRRFYRGKLKLVAFLPFSHVFGLTACLMWFSAFGRTFVFLRDYSPETILNTCRLHAVTHVFAVPLLWDALAEGVLREARKSGQERKLRAAVRLSLAAQTLSPRAGMWLASRLFHGARARLLGDGVRFAISGGGPLREDTARLLNALGYNLHNGYGMTEIGIASVALGRRPRRRPAASVGKPLPSLEYRLDGEGRLSVRGESCMRAIYSGGERRPLDGWIDTGDVLAAAGHGEYAVVGRADDLLSAADGVRVSPDAVEAALTVEGVCGLCALAGADGELLLILEMPAGAGAYRRARALESACKSAAALSFAMRPKRILFSAEPLPRTAAGKVKRAALRERLRSGDGAFGEAMSAPADIDEAYREDFQRTLEAVRGCFCDVLGAPSSAVLPDSDFLYDLSGDSLRYFALLSAIEARFALKGAAKELNGLLTPRSFAERIINT